MARGEWPPVTVVVAAWNEEEAIEATLERLAATTYPGRRRGRARGQQLHRPHRRARRGGGARLGLDYRRCSSRSRASSTPSTGCSRRSRRRSWSPWTPTPTSTPSAQLPRRAGDRASAGSARLRLCRRHRRRERSHQLPHPDAAMGLPTRDQRRQADAGRLQQRPRRPRRLLRLLDRGRPSGRRLARRDRRGHRPHLDDDGSARHRPAPAEQAAGAPGLARRPSSVSDQPQIQDGCDVLQVLPGK